MQHLDDGVLHALLDGEIPSSELPPIQAHLASCPECRVRFAEEQSMLAEAAGLVDALELPAGSAGARQASPAPRRPAWPRRLAWAASLAAALGLGYLARGPGGPAEQAQLKTGVGAADETAVAATPAPADSGLGARSNAPAAPASRPAARNAATAAAAPAQSAVQLATGKASRQAARDSAAAERPAEPVKPRSEIADEARPQASGRVAAAAPPAPVQPADQPRRLEAFRATSALASQAEKVLPPAETITLPDALRRLNGSLRLIDGLIALRLEAQGPFVRVVYPAAQGELVLSQQLIDGRVVWTLLAPPGFPADSLGRLRTRVRE